MISFIFGACSGLAFAMFFPEPFTKLKAWVIDLIKEVQK